EISLPVTEPDVERIVDEPCCRHEIWVPISVEIEHERTKAPLRPGPNGLSFDIRGKRRCGGKKSGPPSGNEPYGRDQRDCEEEGPSFHEVTLGSASNQSPVCWKNDGDGGSVPASESARPELLRQRFRHEGGRDRDAVVEQWIPVLPRNRDLGQCGHIDLAADGRIGRVASAS